MASERPISTVLHDIVGNVRDIIRAELRLAKSELGDEVGKARSSAILVAAGALLLVFALLFALIAAMYALSEVLPAWLAAMLLAVGIAAVAIICVLLGIKAFRTVHNLRRTAATMKENIEWAREQTR